MPHLLELFSGTGSMGKAFGDKGWLVTSVDIREDFHPSILCDVMAFDVKMLEGLPPVDLLWASLPVHTIAAQEQRPRHPETS